MKWLKINVFDIIRIQFIAVETIVANQTWFKRNDLSKKSFLCKVKEKRQSSGLDTKTCQPHIAFISAPQEMDDTACVAHRMTFLIWTDNST